MIQQTILSNIPHILVFNIYKQDVMISDNIVIKKDNKSKILYLRDIIYFGAFHITSRIILSNQTI
jgi:hypothetical protein